MQIRRYTMAAIIFMILVGWYTYAFVTHDSVAVDLYFLHLTLPVAFWVLVPVILFYIASVVHIVYHWVVHRLKLRLFKKDFEKLTAAIRDAYLGIENRSTIYKTERYKLIGKLIDNSILVPSDKLHEVGEPNIDRALSIISALKDGESVDLKNLVSDRNNTIVVRNQINRLENGDLKPVAVLSKEEHYAKEVCVKAFEMMLVDKPVYELEKYKTHMSKEAMFDLMKRVGVDKNKLEVTNESMIAIITQHTLNEGEYVELSKILSKAILPDQRIKIFEILYDKDDVATAAYLYTLFDLEMIALADEVLEQAREDELMAFRAYRDLKAANKNYPIGLFVK